MVLLPANRNNFTDDVKRENHEEIIIPPRSFNHLQFSEDRVTKSSSSSAIHGEIFFYKNIPPSLQKFFPNLISICEHPPSLCIQRIHGTTLSTIFTSCQLRLDHVQRLLQTLRILHAYESCPQDEIVYRNHMKKVKSRFLTYQHSVYSKLGLKFETHFKTLLAQLQLYENQQRAIPVGIIHGDPVLTNIILDSTDENLKLIDMRGAQGTFRTTIGDAIYDLAKVYQSLIGYDFIVSNVSIPTAMCGQLIQNITAFEDYLKQMYPTVTKEDIWTVCCGLVTSLIPLHDDENHRMKFTTIAEVLLEASVQKHYELRTNADVVKEILRRI